jgi:hypothetical protein
MREFLCKLVDDFLRERSCAGVELRDVGEVEVLDGRVMEETNE